MRRAPGPASGTDPADRPRCRRRSSPGDARCRRRHPLRRAPRPQGEARPRSPTRRAIDDVGVPRTWSPASATRATISTHGQMAATMLATTAARNSAHQTTGSPRRGRPGPRGGDRRELTHTHVGHHQVREGDEPPDHGHAGRAGRGGKTGHGPDVLVGARLPDEPAHGGREERKAADPHHRADRAGIEGRERRLGRRPLGGRKRRTATRHRRPRA